MYLLQREKLAARIRFLGIEDNRSLQDYLCIPSQRLPLAGTARSRILAPMSTTLSLGCRFSARIPHERCYPTLLYHQPTRTTNAKCSHSSVSIILAPTTRSWAELRRAIGRTYMCEAHRDTALSYTRDQLGATIVHLISSRGFGVPWSRSVSAACWIDDMQKRRKWRAVCDVIDTGRPDERGYGRKVRKGWA